MTTSTSWTQGAVHGVKSLSVIVTAVLKLMASRLQRPTGLRVALLPQCIVHAADSHEVACIAQKMMQLA